MKTILAIGSGSFIGGVLRNLHYSTMQGKAKASFPFGTMSVNLVGCLIIGLIIGFGERSNINQEWKLFLTTGLCGGFSAFSLETIGLLKSGEASNVLAYVGVSVLFGLLGALFGFTLVKMY